MREKPKREREIKPMRRKRSRCEGKGDGERETKTVKGRPRWLGETEIVAGRRLERYKEDGREKERCEDKRESKKRSYVKG